MVVFIVTGLSVCNILEKIGRVNVIEKLVAFLTVVKASGNFLALSEKNFVVLEAVPEAIGNDFAVAGNAILTVGVVAVSIGTKFLLVVTTSVILGTIDLVAVVTVLVSSAPLLVVGAGDAPSSAVLVVV